MPPSPPPADRPRGHYISYSRISSFMRCRQADHYARTHTPAMEPISLRFGGAWANAMSAYWSPEQWRAHQLNRAAQLAAARVAFVSAIDEALPTFLEHARASEDEVREWFAEARDLGIRLLGDYDEWARVWARDWTPKAAEQTVIVDIPHPDYYDQGTLLQCGPGEQVWCGKHEDPWPVRYLLRMDGIVELGDGTWWLREDKTTRQRRDGGWTELDRQVYGYLWGVSRSGEFTPAQLDRIVGALRVETLKRPYEPPRLLASGVLSTDRRQHTSLGRWKAAAGQHPPKTPAQYDGYTKMEQHLSGPDAPAVVRVLRHEVSRELIEATGREIAAVTYELLDRRTRRYRNPGPMTCTSCRFRDPCLAEARGGPDAAAAVLASRDRYVPRAERPMTEDPWSAPLAADPAPQEAAP